MEILRQAQIPVDIDPGQTVFPYVFFPAGKRGVNANGVNLKVIDPAFLGIECL
jgi:hypothetical protein